MNIREMRNIIGFSQDKFCVMIGVSKNRLCREETDGDVLKDYEKIIAIEVIKKITNEQIYDRLELLKRIGGL